MRNTTTNCDVCNKKLVRSNKITVSPVTGYLCKSRAWCVDCFNSLVQHKSVLQLEKPGGGRVIKGTNAL